MRDRARPIAVPLLVLALAATGAVPVAGRPSTSPSVVVGWGRDNLFQASPPAIRNAIMIDTGAAHGVALLADGTVVVWGHNGYGQQEVPAGLTGVTAIAAGAYHTLALKSDKTVVGWGGEGTYGQGEVPAGVNDAIGVAAGGFFSAILHEGGTVTAWGRNEYDETAVPPGLTGVAKIVAGWSHTVALKSDQTVVCWGTDFYGESTVPAGLKYVNDIAAGDSHSLAKQDNGTFVLWGWDNHGQGTNVLGISGPLSFDGGQYNSVALKSDHTIAAWGYDLSGVNNVPSIYTGASAARISEEHGIAILEDAYPLTVTKKSVKNLYPAGKPDSASFTGTITDLPPGFTLDGLGVDVFISGATQQFTLDAKGAAKAGKSSFKSKLKDGVWTVTVKLSGEYTDAFATEGALLNRNEEYGVAIPVEVEIPAVVRYLGTAHAYYKTAADKAGSAK